ncbi:Carbon starvation protein A [Campylobacter coli]|nr:Carbon starvation protein A [Campylobacter coli]
MCLYLHPGLYFAINSSSALIGSDVASAAQAISSWGFSITPEEISTLTANIGEYTILSRTGGAPTFAIGVALILHGAFWWY